MGGTTFDILPIDIFAGLAPTPEQQPETTEPDGTSTTTISEQTS